MMSAPGSFAPAQQMRAADEPAPYSTETGRERVLRLVKELERAVLDGNLEE
ncbi:MAG TPA: hypothetical protein P5137_04355 [Candidatus Brocadiia bacterium]|nr:hypothetical protein [Candidatus Brocadiia bacterium]